MLNGDICISVSGKPVVFHFWLSTAMLEGSSLTLQKSELDKANKLERKRSLLITVLMFFFFVETRKRFSLLVSTLLWCILRKLNQKVQFLKLERKI